MTPDWSVFGCHGNDKLQIKNSEHMAFCGITYRLCIPNMKTMERYDIQFSSFLVSANQQPRSVTIATTFFFFFFKNPFDLNFNIVFSFHMLNCKTTSKMDIEKLGNDM